MRAGEILRLRCGVLRDQEDDGDGQRQAQRQVQQNVAHVRDRGRREGRDVGSVQQQNKERDGDPLGQLGLH